MSSCPSPCLLPTPRSHTHSRVRPLLRHLDLRRPGDLCRSSVRAPPRRSLVPRRPPARPPHGGEPLLLRGGRALGQEDPDAGTDGSGGGEGRGEVFGGGGWEEGWVGGVEEGSVGYGGRGALDGGDVRMRWPRSGIAAASSISVLAIVFLCLLDSVHRHRGICARPSQLQVTHHISWAIYPSILPVFLPSDSSSHAPHQSMVSAWDPVHPSQPVFPPASPCTQSPSFSFFVHCSLLRALRPARKARARATERAFARGRSKECEHRREWPQGRDTDPLELLTVF